MSSPENLKMYIAVLDEFPDHMTPVLVAHAVLRADVKFSWQGTEEDIDYIRWKIYSFKKCVIRVNQKEFNKIKALDKVCVSHENKTLEGKDSCVVVCPRTEVPNVLKFAKLWKPKENNTND